MKRFLLLGLLLFVVIASSAQAPSSTVVAPPTLVPFDPTPIAAALGSQSAWTTWAQTAIGTLGTNQATDEAKLKTLSDQSATVATLQSQIQTLQQQVADLQNQLKALQTKTQTAGSALVAP